MKRFETAGKDTYLLRELYLPNEERGEHKKIYKEFRSLLARLKEYMEDKSQLMGYKKDNLKNFTTIIRVWENETDECIENEIRQLKLDSKYGFLVYKTSTGWNIKGRDITGHVIKDQINLIPKHQSHYRDSLLELLQDKRNHEQLLASDPLHKIIVDYFGYYRPSIFISYSWPTKDYPDTFKQDSNNRRDIHKLAKDLEKGGFRVLMDKNDLTRVDDLDRFMDLIDSKDTDYVCVMGTPLYQKKYSLPSLFMDGESNKTFVEAKAIIERTNRSTIFEQRTITALIDGEKTSSFPTQLKSKIFCNFNAADYFNTLLSLFFTLYRYKDHMKDKTIKKMISEFNSKVRLKAGSGVKSVSPIESGSLKFFDPRKSTSPHSALRHSEGLDHLSHSFCWNLPKRNHLHVPCPVDTDINKFTSDLETDDNPILLLLGPKGNGKTHQAKEILHRLSNKFYPMKLYFDAHSREILLDQYRKLIISRKLTGLNLKVSSDSPDTIIVTSFKQYFSENSGWVILYDNAESYEFLEHFLPSNMPGLVIATSSSESSRWNKSESYVKKIEIPTMAYNESLELFLRSMGIAPSERALNISQDNNFLNGKQTSYSIVKAASYVLNKLCQGHPENLTAKKINGFIYEYDRERNGEPLNRWLVNKLIMGLSIKFTKAERLSHSAALQILNFFSLLYKDSLTEKMIFFFINNFGIKEEHFIKAINALVNFGLIYEEELEGEKVFSLDGTTQDVLRNPSDPESLIALTKKTAGIFLLYLHRDKYDIHCDQRRDFKHFFSFLSYLENILPTRNGGPSHMLDSIFIKVFMRAQMIFVQLGGADALKMAIRYGEKTLSLTDYYYGTNNLKYAISLIHLARTYDEIQGDENLRKAIDYFNQAIVIIEGLFQRDDSKVDYKPQMYKGDCYRGIALCYFGLAMAETQQEQKKKHLETATKYNNDATVCYTQCIGMPVLKQQYSLFRVKNNQALVYWRNGELHHAADNYKSLLEERIKLRQDTSSSVDGTGGKLEEAIVRVNLGMCQYEMKNYDDAVESLKAILELQDAIMNHPGLGLAYFYLGLCMLLSDNSGKDLHNAFTNINQGILIVKDNVFSPNHSFVNFLSREMELLKAEIQKHPSLKEKTEEIIDDFERWIHSGSNLSSSPQKK